jgi:uncharacterized protein (TIGR00730 family)
LGLSRRRDLGLFLRRRRGRTLHHLLHALLVGTIEQSGGYSDDQDEENQQGGERAWHRTRDILERDSSVKVTLQASQAFVFRLAHRLKLASPTRAQPACLPFRLISAVRDAMARCMKSLNSICVYCGSGLGARPVYAESARILGRSMAETGVRLIYGGGSVGLMGTVARAVLEAGGEVTGIIPAFLQSRERPMPDLTELVVTEDMHERKRLMFERADAFVALAGGVGTLEEVVEQMTWAQLGQHHKPVLLANVAGFWDPLIHLLDTMRAENFIRSDLDVTLLVAKQAEDIVPMLRHSVASRPRREAAEAEPLSRM